jgi:PAS domain S-box-containing protein
MQKKADDLFRHICEAAPDGIIVVDRQGCVILANKQAESMFGVVHNELLGQRVEALIPAPAREAHLEFREEYARRPETRPMGTGRNLLAQRKNGSEFPVEISLSPFESGGEQLVVAVVRDISQRRRLESEREHLRAIADRELERQRIAMDLHDGIIQSIYATALELEMAADDVKDKPHHAVAEINRSIDQLNDTIRDLRGYILDLRPPRYGGDLHASLASLLTELRANSLVEVAAEIPETLPELGEEKEAAIFHIVQEAFNNVRKHSAATQLSLRLAVNQGALELDIEDDGCGFEPEMNLDESHHGMRNMLSRASSAGGILRVETAPRAGTRVHLEVPVPER